MIDINYNSLTLTSHLWQCTSNWITLPVYRYNTLALETENGEKKKWSCWRIFCSTEAFGAPVKTCLPQIEPINIFSVFFLQFGSVPPLTVDSQAFQSNFQFNMFLLWILNILPDKQFWALCLTKWLWLFSWMDSMFDDVSPTRQRGLILSTESTLRRWMLECLLALPSVCLVQYKPSWVASSPPPHSQACS